MGDEKKKKVIKPEDEKKRIKDMAKKERMKKILTEDMERFGPREESEPIKIPMGAGVGRVLEPKPMGKKKGGKIGKGMTKNNYKKGGSCGSKMKMKKGGAVKHRGDGCATKGKTKGRMV
jgi:hypothetical protein